MVIGIAVMIFLSLHKIVHIKFQEFKELDIEKQKSYKILKSSVRNNREKRTGSS